MDLLLLEFRENVYDHADIRLTQPFSVRNDVQSRHFLHVSHVSNDPVHQTLKFLVGRTPFRERPIHYFAEVSRSGHEAHDQGGKDFSKQQKLILLGEYRTKSVNQIEGFVSKQRHHLNQMPMIWPNSMKDDKQIWNMYSDYKFDKIHNRLNLALP